MREARARHRAAPARGSSSPTAASQVEHARGPYPQGSLLPAAAYCLPTLTTLTALQTEEKGFAPFARFQRTLPTRISTEYSLLGPTQPSSNSIQTTAGTGPIQPSSLQPPTKHTVSAY